MEEEAGEKGRTLSSCSNPSLPHRLNSKMCCCPPVLSVNWVDVATRMLSSGAAGASTSARIALSSWRMTGRGGGELARELRRERGVGGLRSLVMDEASSRSRGGMGGTASTSAAASSSSKKSRRVVGSVDWRSACVNAMMSFSASARASRESVSRAYGREGSRR